MKRLPIFPVLSSILGNLWQSLALLAISFMFLSLTTVVASAVAASYAGYATMSPASQLYGQTLTHSADPTQMALTFDDGPNDPHSLHLLDVLAQHGARATFFVIGKYVRQRPDVTRAIHDAGHAVGNHTYSHPNLIFASARRLRIELEDCRKALEDAIGAPAPLFRPPFGGRRPNVLRTARAMGMEPVMWSVTSFDWNARSSDEIVQKVTERIDSRRRPQGEIVLLHDGSHLGLGADRSHTVAATRALLEKYSGQGRKFVSIEELTTGSHAASPKTR